MATFKTVVRKMRRDGYYPVYIRCVHNMKPAYIKTEKVVHQSMIGKNGEISDPFIIEYCARRILEYTDKLNRKEIGNWTVKQVIEFLTMENDKLCFSDYARLHIDRLINRGQVRNARNYKLSLQHLERYAGTTKVMFSFLTSSWINTWIKSLENTARAKELYPVCIRQIFREAIKDYNDYDNEVIRIKTNPWAKVEIPQSDRAEKRAISAEDCRKFFYNSSSRVPCGEAQR